MGHDGARWGRLQVMVIQVQRLLGGHVQEQDNRHNVQHGD